MIGDPRLDAISRARGLASLYSFVRIMWRTVEPNQPFAPNWHLEHMCAALESVHHGEYPDLALFVPPASGKSLLVNCFFPAFEWLTDPAKAYLSVSFDPDLALRDARRTRDLVNSDLYQRLWPGRVSIPEGQPAGDYYTSKGGRRYSTSIGGALTGNHFHVHLLDDLIKPQDISPATLGVTTTWWQRTRPSRFKDPAKASTVLICQRLCEADPGELAVNDGFKVVNLPVRWTPDATISRPGYEKDGDLLWRARFPEIEIQRIEKRLGSQNFASQYLQRPFPAGGLLFRAEWMKQHWAPETLPKKWDKCVLSVDAAFKGTATSDYVVIQCWGRRGPNFYLIDQVRSRMNFDATLAAILAMVKKHPYATARLIESAANGAAIVDTLGKRLTGVIGLPAQGSKMARAQATTDLWEAGNVWLPPPGTPGLDDFKAELLGFDKARNDDQVDSMSQGVGYLRKARGRLEGFTAGIQAAGGVGGFFDQTERIRWAVGGYG
jgi:predicted phage terminase large subunit-like protein